MWVIRVCTVLVSMLLMGGVIAEVGAPAARAACQPTTSTTVPGARASCPQPKRLVRVCVQRSTKKTWTRNGYVKRCLRTELRWV
jgi:hypothetical protein